MPLETLTSKLIVLLVTLFSFAVWNGIVNLWGYETNTRKKIALLDMWHVLGWVYRAGFVLYVAMAYGLFWAWIAFIISWHIYDITINLIRSDKWYYSGTFANFDKQKTLTWIAKILFLLLGLLFLIH